jgi:hypothetical protein
MPRKCQRTIIGCFTVLFAIWAVVFTLTTTLGQARPEAELAAVIRGFLARNFAADWRALEGLALVKWAALPPTELRN